MLTTTPAETLPPLEGTISLETAEEEGEGVGTVGQLPKGRPFFTRQATSVQLTISQGSHRPFVRIRIHWRLYHDYLHPLLTSRKRSVVQTQYHPRIRFCGSARLDNERTKLAAC